MLKKQKVKRTLHFTWIIHRITNVNVSNRHSYVEHSHETHGIYEILTASTFQELVKYSKRIGEDCTDLQKALELFLGIPNRATNNKFIASIEGYRGNIYKLGRLLTHDWFTVTDVEDEAGERYLFLFKARILISKVRRVEDNRSVFELKDIIKVWNMCILYTYYKFYWLTYIIFNPFKF